MLKSYIVYRHGIDAGNKTYKIVCGSVEAKSAHAAELAACRKYQTHGRQYLTVTAAREVSRQDIDDAAAMNQAEQMLARVLV